ncbi:MAG: helix-hairpin-helix domain-containing protein [Prevotella sp.]|nr:helix-hairpin-helix domain-containing protein [Prevotella sp.]
MRLKEFFYLCKSDREVMIVLMIITTVVSLLIFGFGSDEATPFPTAADSTLAFPEQPRSGYTERRDGAEPYYNVRRKETRLFSFDPNTADSTQLLQLGLESWQVRNIYKYRARGGVFRRKEDFARVYGLTKGQYEALEPYINIADDYRPAAEIYADSEDEHVERDTLRYPAKLKAGEFVTLNLADTMQLRKVPGVGNYYSQQIVQYGRRLGGYADVSQLMEIEGFPEEALDYFRVDRSKVSRLNLNKATMSQLRRHPYLNFYQARAIVDYRRLHGALKSLDDLSLHPDFPQEALRRLEPYVEF